MLLLVFLLSSSAMAEEEKKHEEEAEEEEPFLGTLDYVLLAACAVGGAYYFLVMREGKEETKMPSYVIQPTAAPSAASMGDKSFIAKMRNSKRRLVVFYGSQTGTAEEFAGRLAKEGARYGLKGIVADPEECEMDDLAKIRGLEDELDGPTLAVFMMATYGEGDPTDNAQEFYDWLKGEPEGLEGEQEHSSFGHEQLFPHLKLHPSCGDVSRIRADVTSPVEYSDCRLSGCQHEHLIMQ